VMTHLSLVTVLTYVVWFFPQESMGKSADYYQILREFSEGKDFYAVLGITETATTSETKKAWYKQSLLYHPDKNKDPGAAEVYLLIQRAYEILSDEEMKADYDRFRTEGIPLHERYYGVYMHEWGVPKHDIRVVVVWLIIILTIAKHCYQWWRHVSMRERAKQTMRYKKAVKEAKQESSPKSKKSRDKTKETELEAEDPEIEVKVHGAEMPTWQDLFIIQLITSPYYFCKAIYLIVINWNVPRKSREELLKEQLGLSDEDFEAWKAKQLYKYQQRMNSGKMKRYQRWLRKQ